MKKATSNKAIDTSEGRLRTATTKALAAEKAARAEKEKARLAKRRYKDARKAFKHAKKAAKKAAKHTRQAQKELKACIDMVAREKKHFAMRAKRAAVQDATASAKISTGGSKRTPVVQRRKATSNKSGPEQAVSGTPQPAEETSGSVESAPVSGLST